MILEILQGERFLVHGTRDSHTIGSNTEEETKHDYDSLLISDVSLSFWGGIDPVTGTIIDISHPLYNESVCDKIFCLPSGRGSCTASQVLLELILNHKAPKAIVLRDVDGLACVGALIAKEVFLKNDSNNSKNNHNITVPDILHIGDDSFQKLLDISSNANNSNANQSSSSRSIDVSLYGSVLENGTLLVSNNPRIKNFNKNNGVLVKQQQNKDVVFTKEENELLQACKSDAERIALRVIFQYAHIITPASEGTSYISVSKAHIDGCTYIGPGGLQYVQRLVKSGGAVKIPTTLNSISTDRRRYQKYGVPIDYATSSIQLSDAYLALGCNKESFTCAPYLLPSSTSIEVGDDIAWGESNAVVYANSVLGARTEKYADYLDICCAITGMAPAIGVHLEENRKPQVILDATDVLQELWMQMNNNENKDDSQSNHIKTLKVMDSLFPILGHLCGSLSDGKVPILLGFEEKNNVMTGSDESSKNKNIKNDKEYGIESSWSWSSIITTDHLKGFCAAFGTTGTSPLIHVAGITPEAKHPDALQALLQDSCNSGSIIQRKTLTLSQLEETFHTLDYRSNHDNLVIDNDQSSTCNDKVHLIALGNPHLSVTECENLVGLIQELNNNDDNKNKKHPSVRIMACMSRTIYSEASEKGYIDFLKEFGVEFINDTCWCMLLDAPIIPPIENGIILTNSGKYAHYGPGLTNKQFRFGSTYDCIQSAMTGTYPRKGTVGEGWKSTGNRSSIETMPYWLLPSSSPKARTVTIAATKGKTREAYRSFSSFRGTFTTNSSSYSGRHQSLIHNNQQCQPYYRSFFTVSGMTTSIATTTSSLTTTTRGAVNATNSLLFSPLPSFSIMKTQRQSSARPSTKKNIGLLGLDHFFKLTRNMSIKGRSIMIK